MNAIFGLPLNRVVLQNQIPDILEQIFQTVSQVSQPDLFSLPHNAQQVLELKQAIEAYQGGGQSPLQFASPQVVGGLLVHFFKSLPLPVVPPKFIGNLVFIGSIQSQQLRCEQLRVFFAKIPKSSNLISLRLFSCLRATQIDPKILSNLFAGSIARQPQESPDAPLPQIVTAIAEAILQSDYINLVTHVPIFNSPTSPPSENDKRQDALVGFDFDATADSMLSLRVGQVVTLTNAFPDNWLEGILNGRKGYLPSGFIELIAMEAPAQQQQIKPPAQQQMQPSAQIQPPFQQQQQQQQNQFNRNGQGFGQQQSTPGGPGGFGGPSQGGFGQQQQQQQNIPPPQNQPQGGFGMNKSSSGGGFGGPQQQNGPGAPGGFGQQQQNTPGGPGGFGGQPQGGFGQQQQQNAPPQNQPQGGFGMNKSSSGGGFGGPQQNGPGAGGFGMNKPPGGGFNGSNTFNSPSSGQGGFNNQNNQQNRFGQQQQSAPPQNQSQGGFGMNKPQGGGFGTNSYNPPSQGSFGGNNAGMNKSASGGLNNPPGQFSSAPGGFGKQNNPPVPGGGFGGPNNSPAFGGNNNPPAFGGNNNSPAFGGNNNTPAFGGNNNTPGGFGGNNPPAFGGNNNSPAFGGNNNPPAFGGNNNAPGGFGGNNNPPAFGGNNSPAFGGNNNAPGGFGGNNSNNGFGPNTNFTSPAGMANPNLNVSAPVSAPAPASASADAPAGGAGGNSNDFKVVVVGSGGVGKSALTISFVQNHFIVDYDPTIEDSYRKQATVDDSPCFLNILDTAGQEEYSAMRDLYMRKGQGFLLVFSLTARSTFDEVGPLRNKILQVKDVDKIPIIIAGNKWDLRGDHQVSKTEAEEFSKSLGCNCLMTSAKDRYNVEECFHAIVREIRSDPTNKKKKAKGGCALL